MTQADAAREARSCPAVAAPSPVQAGPGAGPYGRLAFLAWTLLLVSLAPAWLGLPAAGLALGVNLLVYPRALRRTLRWQWLIFLGLLFAGSALWGGERDALLGPLAYSRSGALAGAQMALRAFVIFTALDGLASSVQISEIAGLLERLGLRGLGFSAGVAMNLLPALQRSSLNAWHSLRMRGGLRQQRWRAIQLLAVTIAAGALRRSEEIALAAEARAFTPERARSLPVRRGKLDPWLWGAAGGTAAALIVLRFAV
jgi:energy-coupling factor transport system permease protein